MFTDKYYPDRIAAESLDTYLEKGWYRMGQSIFTTHFLSFDRHFYSAIWIRLPLNNYVFSKRLRKLCRRNDELFRCEYGPMRLDEEKETLYQRYRNTFPGVLSYTLKEALLDEEESNVYSTWEVRLYHNEQLVAFSFFDIGQHSAASIQGVYAPDYRGYSLGFYTMLLEIKWCMNQGMSHYYPGYVVPGYERFEYKKRIGPVEYYDLHSDDWLPLPQLKAENIPLPKMQTRLQILESALREQQIPCRYLHYPFFEANLFSFFSAPYLDYPVLLWCYPQEGAKTFLIAVFNVREDAWQLLKCATYEDMFLSMNAAYAASFDKRLFFLELASVDAVLCTTNDAVELAEVLRAYTSTNGNSNQFEDLRI